MTPQQFISFQNWTPISKKVFKANLSIVVATMVVEDDRATKGERNKTNPKGLKLNQLTGLRQKTSLWTM